MSIFWSLDLAVHAVDGSFGVLGHGVDLEEGAVLLPEELVQLRDYLRRRLLTFFPQNNVRLPLFV